MHRRLPDKTPALAPRSVHKCPEHRANIGGLSLIRSSPPQCIRVAKAFILRKMADTIRRFQVPRKCLF